MKIFFQISSSTDSLTRIFLSFKKFHKMKVLIFLFSIFSSTFAISFNCTFSVVNLVVVGERYTCTAILSNYEEGKVLTEVTGNHLPGRNNSNVVSVTINSHAVLSFIPQGMHNFFPHIGAITVFNCNISELNDYDLRDHIDLEYLSLLQNRIQHIPGDFFENTPRMRYMNFNNNQIRYAGENLIEHLFTLNQALFSNNICINYSVTNSSFACLIGTLRVYCPDIQYETTTPDTTTYHTTDLTVPPTTSDPVCNMHDSVCNIEHQNSEIMQSIENLTEENRVIKEMLDEILRIITL